MQFVVPGAGLRRERALAVDERHVRVRDASAWSIAANCRSMIFMTANLDACDGKPRRSKVGFSHGPRKQTPRPSGMAKS